MSQVPEGVHEKFMYFLDFLVLSLLLLLLLFRRRGHHRRHLLALDTVGILLLLCMLRRWF